jgi:hypothetical protein
LPQGGARPGAGRPKGVKNRPKELLPHQIVQQHQANVAAAKRSAREIALGYAEQAFAVLAEIMVNKAAPASARVSAAVAIHDRAYGKAPQAITGPDGEGPVQFAVVQVEYLDPDPNQPPLIEGNAIDGELAE